MKHEDFAMGLEFYTASGKWRCTDIGTRTIVAIRIDSFTKTEFLASGETRCEQVTDDQSWFIGPPYAVAEHIFDEFDVAGCYLEPDVFSNQVND